MKTCRSPTLNMTKLIADLKDIFRSERYFQITVKLLQWTNLQIIILLSVKGDILIKPVDILVDLAVSVHKCKVVLVHKVLEHKVDQTCEV